MGLPKYLEQALIAHRSWIENDLYCLRMAGEPSAHLLIGRIGRVSANVADCRDMHAPYVPERLFRAPVAAESEIGDLAALGIRALERSAVHEMLSCRENGLRSPR